MARKPGGVHCTLGPAYNEFGYNEHLAYTSTFLCIKVIDSNVKEFGYNEQAILTSSFFCIFTRCKRDPVYKDSISQSIHFRKTFYGFKQSSERNRTLEGLFPWGLCLGGSLSRGSLSIGSVARGSLSRGISVQEVSVQGVSVHEGGLCQGGISVKETTRRTVTCGRYASYWNAFLFVRTSLQKEHYTRSFHVSTNIVTMA